MLLISLFGNTERYVPAHMPHLINKAVLAKIEQRIGPHFQNTMSHRFRSSDDLQFAFMYFYFLRHFEQEKEDRYYESLWDQYLDVDHNGVLDPNEFRTLASVVYNNKVTDEFPPRDAITYPISVENRFLHAGSIATSNANAR